MSSLDYTDRTLLIRKPNLFTVISTFSGCGGSSTGYTWAGGWVKLAVEWDANAVETYRLNYPDSTVYHGDIAALSASECLRLARLKPGELDILDGSPPCQGFSMIGKREFSDQRNQLFREYVRLLRELQPKVFVMENVSGLVKGKMKLIFAEMLGELKRAGYNVSARLLNAKYFGVPQSRERIIIIGVRTDLKLLPTHPGAAQRPISAGEALRSVINDEAERAWLLAMGEKYQAYRMWHLLAPGQKQTDVGALVGFSARKFHPSRPAFTIVKNDAEVSMHGSMHWLERRRFTVAEYKRFSSFPDAYQFAGGWANAVARMGNSVPPRFMQAIAEHIYEHILTRI